MPGFQGRCYHSAAAFTLGPGLVEVVIFGGCPEWPSTYKSDRYVTPIANTTVLRFGECMSCSGPCNKRELH